MHIYVFRIVGELLIIKITRIVITLLNNIRCRFIIYGLCKMPKYSLIEINLYVHHFIINNHSQV